MLAQVEFTPWHWVVFILGMVVFLALDLGFFHRSAQVAKVREALIWTVVWFLLAVLFGAGLALWGGRRESVQFFTGYFIELSLSMDNVFVIALIFAFFHVPPAYQHRLLFWGILGALVMRLVMILLGVALINRFDWLLYVLGAFLIVTGAKMLLARSEQGQLETNIIVRVARKFLPVSTEFDGQKFFSRVHGETGFDAAVSGAGGGGGQRFDLRRRFHSGHLRRDARSVHRFYLERFCHFGSALALLRAGGGDGHVPVFEVRPVRRAGVHRRKDADRSARPAGAVVVSV